MRTPWKDNWSEEAIARCVALICPAFTIILLHLLLPFRFPIPWPDETSFIAPALALARHGTLFVWGVNPDRVVMWMPPGYMVLLAGLFKIFGYSFALVRWTSAACVGAALFIVCSIVSRATCGWRSTLLHGATAVAFLSPYVLMSANIGRMEALLVLLMLLSLLACRKGLPVLGGAVVAASAVIHFNAVFFTAPILTYLVWLGATRVNLIVRPIELAGIAFAGLILAGYAALILDNAGGFVSDMTVQFQLKRYYGYDPAYPHWPMIVTAALCLVVCISRRKIDGPVFLALYGAGFVFMALKGREIWYDIGLPVGFLLMAIGFVEAYSGFKSNRFLHVTCAATCLVLMVLMGYRSSPLLAGLLPTPSMLSHDLLPKSDIRAMRSKLAALPPGTKVFFAWIGVQPFFLDTLDRAGVLWGAPQHSVTDATRDRIMDWRVQCDSPDTPQQMWIYFPRELHGSRETGCDIHKF